MPGTSQSELHGGKPLNPLVNAGAMATVSLVNGADADEIWANMMNNFNSFANTALTVNQEIYKSESATNQHNRGIEIGRASCRERVLRLV